MKRLIAVIVMALLPIATFASGAEVELEKANVDLHNEAAIQRGAKYFVNYCMGCHSAKHVRYKLFTKVGLNEDQIKRNLIFNGAKVHAHMTNAMSTEYAAEAFGAPAPDLTLEGRRRGADWVYTYLKSFYTDPSRPTGVNNKVFHNVGMPNVLWELEGIKDPVYRYEVLQNGHVVAESESEDEANAKAKSLEGDVRVEKVVDHFAVRSPGKLSAGEFDQVARDLATFLSYIGEPIKLERQRLGVRVLLFLVIFTILAYMMKKEWWKDVH
ncbi:MAG: cytochrome c1 [Gammaproteobacteria bacterium]|nr:MAG: cytochrome c1 [Gammaproteobacteria bacterium]